MGNLCTTGHARQTISNALKHIRKTKEITWVTYRKWRLQLQYPDQELNWSGYEALVLLKGRIKLCELIDKDGLVALPLDNYSSAKIQPKAVLALVLHKHLR